MTDDTPIMNQRKGISILEYKNNNKHRHRDKVIAWRKEGLTLREIANKLNFKSATSVGHILRYVPRQPKKVSCSYCSRTFFLNARYINGTNVCPPCFETYLVRPNGSQLEGMDYTRELVRMRDKHTCQECGKKWIVGERRFDIHHLEGLCGKLSRSYDKKITMDRLVTMCHKCHLNLPEVREKMSKENRLSTL